MQPQPILPDWAAEVERYWEHTGNTKRDLQLVIHYIQEIIDQLEQSYKYVTEQRNRVLDIQNNLVQLYKLRFQEDPPQRRESEVAQLVMLNTPEERSEAIRAAALALTEPGSMISSENILDYLTEKGARIVAQNPKATVASVLFQFANEFEKVQGRRSVFKRKIRSS